MSRRFVTAAVLFLTAVVSWVCPPIRAEVVEQIVAVVNDEVITQSELSILVAPLFAQLKKNFEGEILLDRLEETRREILQQLIDERLILQSAKKEKVEIENRDVDEKLDEVKARFVSAEEFETALESQGLGVDDLRKKYREQLMARKLVSREVSSKVFVSPSEIAAYYESHKESFRMPESVEVWNILIRADKPADFDQAKAACEKIQRQIQEGSSFEDLAKAQSQGPGRDKGGAMGRIRHGELMKAIDDAIFSLKEGVVSDPIRTDIGYHLFKVAGRQEASILPLEDVKGRIEKALFDEKATVRYQDWIARLRRDAYISIK